MLQRASYYLPGEEVCWQTSLQKLGWPGRAVLRWEELEAKRRIDVVERGILMHATDDHQTTVEDSDGGRVPPPLQEVQIGGVLEDSTSLPSSGNAWLEDTNCLSTELDGRVSGETIGVTTHTDLCMTGE